MSLAMGNKEEVEKFEKKLLEADTANCSLLQVARDQDLTTCRAVWQSLGSTGAAASSTTESGLTLLHFAAVNSEHGLDIAVFFSSILDIGQRDEDGEEPIHYALKKGNYELAKHMLMMRNRGSDNLLQFFVIQDDLLFAKMVHAMDPKLIKAKLKSGNANILHCAASFAGVKMFQWLVEEDTSLVTEANNKGATVMHYAAKNTYEGDQLLAFFSRLGFDMEATDGNLMTPLHYAIESNNLKALKRLLCLGIDTTVRLADFKNPMHFCAEKGRLECAKAIHAVNERLIHGVCLGGLTPLHFASIRGHLQLCKWLVEAGADRKAQDNAGLPPIDLVHENEEIKALLSKAIK